MALGVALTPARAALTLVEGRPSGYVTLDTYTADLTRPVHARSDDSYHQLVDEIIRVCQVLDADGRPLERIGIAAEPHFADAAAALIDALAQVGVDNVGPLLVAGFESVAETDTDKFSYLLQPDGTAAAVHRSAADEAAVSMALAAAADALSDADLDGRTSGISSHPRLPLVLAAAAAAVAVVIGVVGVWLLNVQPGQVDSPSQSPEPAPRSVTSVAPVTSSPELTATSAEPVEVPSVATTSATTSSATTTSATTTSATTTGVTTGSVTTTGVAPQPEPGQRTDTGGASESPPSENPSPVPEQAQAPATTTAPPQAPEPPASPTDTSPPAQPPSPPPAAPGGQP